MPVPTARDMREREIFINQHSSTCVWHGTRRSEASPRVYVKPGGGEREWKRILAETLEETDETCMLCEDAITSNQVALR